jgi:hypothetical protein
MLVIGTEVNALSPMEVTPLGIEIVVVESATV